MGLIKKFSFFGFIKKRLTSSQVGPVRKLIMRESRKPVIIGFALILVVVSTYFLFFFSSEVLAEWWDTNWHYRKAITITNSGSVQTDFQVKVLSNYDMSTDVTNGKVQTDFDDLRFTDINGNALDYWIEDNTAASLDVWVKIDSIPAGTPIVYMYYGNPSASATSNVAYIIGNSTNPGISCTDIKNNRDASDGIYYIDPDGGSSGNKFQAYCDMTIENGGWTEILNLDTNDGVDHWWGDTTFWQSTGTEGSAATSLTSGYKSQAFTDMSSFAEMMIFMHTEGVQVAYGVYDVLGGYQSSSFYNLFSIVNSDAGTTITSTLQHQSGASNVPLNTQRSQTRYGDEFIDIFNTEAIVVNRVKRFNTDGINYMRLATTFDNTSYVHTMSGLGVHHERPTGSYICKVEAAPVTAYCGLVPRYGSDATATGCFCGTVTSYDRDMAIFVRDSTPDAINMSFVTSGLEEKGPGPVGYWSFDEGYGSTAQDRTSNNSDGTIAGATWQTEDMCVSGKCLYFDGSADKVQITDNNIFNISTVTIEMWLKLTDTGPWFGIHRGDGANKWYFYSGSSSTSQFTWFVDNARYDRSAGSPGLNEWHHFAIVISPGSQYTYRDGKLVSSGSVASGLNASSADIQLGQYGSPGSYDLNGFMDEVKIYSYARTAAQIKADYNSGKAGLSSDKGSAVSLGGPTSQGGQTSLSDGLVGYWKMDETSGNVIDASGNGNTGIPTGTTVAAGKYGNGRSFNGTSDYVNCGNNDALNPGTGDFSVGMWVKLPEKLSGNYGVLTKNYNLAYGVFYTSSNDELALYPQSGSNNNGIDISSYYDEWVYVIWTIDNINDIQKSYLNGAFNNQTNYILGDVTSISNLNIGRYTSGSGYFTGYLDEIRIYNRALSAREVKALYEYAPGPVAYYDFDEKTGTTAYDSSGGEYNLTPDGITSADVVIGKFGSAYSYSTSSVRKFYRTGSVPVIKKKLTVSAWVYPRSYPTERACLLVGHSSWAYFLSLNSDGSLNSYWYNTTPAGYHSSGAGTVPLNTWSYLTATWDGSYTRLYVNGIEKNKIVVTGDGVQPTGYYIGAEGTGRRFDGKIDEMRIYNYARTQKQILEDMNAGRPASKSPVGYWKFDEGYGTSTSDSGLGNNDGTITGATWTNAGKLGKALSFDGDDLVSTSLYISSANDFTLSAWINKTSDTGHNTIIGSWIPWIWKITNKAVGFTTYINSIEANVIANTNAEYNEWTHLAVRYIYSEDKVKFYNNGAPDGESVLLGKLNVASNLVYVGGYPSWKFHGLIDEVKVFNYALTDKEIEQEYNQGKVSVMGAVGGDGSGSSSSAGTAEYCIPGSSDSCDPPVAEWNFEEHTGTSAYDSSGNGNTGTLTNMEDSDWTVGKIGGALDFDGDNEYLNYSNTNLSLLGDNSFTIEAWTKPDSFMLDATIFSYGPASANKVISLITDSTGKLRSVHYGNDHTFTVGSLSTGVWQHVAVVYNASTSSEIGYINAINKGSWSPTNLNLDATAICKIGQRTWSSSGLWHGKIDQVRIYDYARTSAQIAWDYNKGKPIAHYKMDKGEGTTIYDSSGNGNNGTLNLGASGQTSAGSVKINANTAWYNGREGKQNYSLNFDGDDDYVEVPDNDVLDFGTGDFSASLWVKTLDCSNNFLYKRSGGTGWFLGTDGSCKPYAYIDNLFTQYVDFTINDGLWHHYVTVFDRDGNYYGYIDGNLEKTTDISSKSSTSVSTATSLLIGNYGGSNFFNDQMDEVKIFNYALTEDQIKTEYNMGAARLGTGE